MKRYNTLKNTITAGLAGAIYYTSLVPALPTPHKIVGTISFVIAILIMLSGVDGWMREKRRERKEETQCTN